MKNCNNCGERQGCTYYKEHKNNPIHCNCYWNSETQSFEKLLELMEENKDVLYRLK